MQPFNARKFWSHARARSDLSQHKFHDSDFRRAQNFRFAANDQSFALVLTTDLLAFVFAAPVTGVPFVVVDEGD